MKIKKKIAVWCSLFAFMLALVPTCSARAEAEITESGLYFDKESGCVYDDYGNFIDVSDWGKEQLNSGKRAIVVAYLNTAKTYYNVYVVYYDAEFDVAFRVHDSSPRIMFVRDGVLESNSNAHHDILRYTISEDGLGGEFSLYSDDSAALLSGTYLTNGGSQYWCINMEQDKSLVYFETDLMVVRDNVLYTDEIYMYADKYSFEEWCADAGLNCSASSNESDSVVPFWYEPDSYNYIVRKTLTASSTSEVYQMTMLQKTDGAHYPYYFEVNDIGYLGVAGAFSDISTFTVRNFYYDAEGNGWKYMERFDVSTLPFDNTNVSFTDNVVFIYSDTDIYADREASLIWKSASTEYYNVDIPEPEITRIPEPTPSPEAEGLEGLIDTAKQLVELIGVVPMMIGAVFGFLPAWCLWILGLSFSFLAVFIVIKLIRG